VIERREDMEKTEAIQNLKAALDREADLDGEAVSMAIAALENQLVEVTQEEMEAMITSIPVNQGGFPKYMLKDSITPTVELLDKRLRLLGLRVAYVKTV